MATTMGWVQLHPPEKGLGMSVINIDYSDLIGAPYGFREWGLAFDCFTIVGEVFHRLGFDEAVPVRIREQFEDGVIRVEEIDPDHWVEVPTCSMVGDVALIRGPKDYPDEPCDGTARHCAIMVGRGMMLEATEKLGVHTIAWRLLRPFAVRCVRFGPLR